MLLLWDRDSLSCQTRAEVRETKAHLLARVKSNLIFKPIRFLSAGSSLAKTYASLKDRRDARALREDSLNDRPAPARWDVRAV